MAWIKVQSTLPESPKIFRLARLLGVGRMEALGYAVRWFCWLDSHCANGATELLEEDVDALIGMSGITRAFCELEWAVVDANGYVLVLEFDKHNGECAKKRAESQVRMAAMRERQKAASGEKGTCYENNVTIASPDKSIYIGNNTVVGSSTVVSAEPAAPAPTPDVNDEGFRGWLAALSEAHPSARKSLYLAPDVLKAAKEAFVRCPRANDAAELLNAFYGDSKAQEHGFYAPRGQRKFFEDLEDVLCHAERWQKWAGWKPKKRAAERGKTVVTPGLEVKRCAGVLVGAEAMAFIRGEVDEV